jgi:hypothetical protein
MTKEKNTILVDHVFMTDSHHVNGVESAIANMTILITSLIQIEIMSSQEMKDDY